MIAKKQYLFSYYSGLLHIYMFIHLLIRRVPTKGKKQLAWLTMWTFWMNFSTFLINFITDTHAYLKKSSKFKWLSDLSRNILSVITSTYSYIVFLIYWVMLSMGPKYMRLEPGILCLFESIYLHLIVTICQVIDAVLTPRPKMLFKKWVYCIDLGIIVLYGVVIVYFKYVIGYDAYPFLSKLGVNGIVIFGIFTSFLIYVSYIFQI